jgi:hypothetical protein
MMVIPRPSRLSLSVFRQIHRERVLMFIKVFQFDFVLCPVAELFVLNDVSFLLMFNLIYFIVRIRT